MFLLCSVFREKNKFPYSLLKTRTEMDVSNIKKRERSANFTAREVEVLLHVIKKYRAVVDDKSNTSKAIKLKNDTWERVASEFNRYSTNLPRAPKTLKWKYDSIKKQSKKRAKDSIEFDADLNRYSLLSNETVDFFQEQLQLPQPDRMTLLGSNTSEISMQVPVQTSSVNNFKTSKQPSFTPLNQLRETESQKSFEETNIALKWGNHQLNIQRMFSTLLAREQYVDVTIACQGMALKCHKIVLSMCSPYFDELLSQNPCQHPIIIIRDVEYCDMKAIIDFIYKGEVNVPRERLLSLLKAAEDLDIKGLRGIGENVLQNKEKAAFAQNKNPFPSMVQTNKKSEIFESRQKSGTKTLETPRSSVEVDFETEDCFIKPEYNSDSDVYECSDENVSLKKETSYNVNESSSDSVTKNNGAVVSKKRQSGKSTSENDGTTFISNASYPRLTTGYGESCLQKEKGETNSIINYLNSSDVNFDPIDLHKESSEPIVNINCKRKMDMSSIEEDEPLCSSVLLKPHYEVIRRRKRKDETKKRKRDRRNNHNTIGVIYDASLDKLPLSITLNSPGQQNETEDAITKQLSDCENSLSNGSSTCKTVETHSDDAET